LPVAHLEALRTLSREKGQALLEELNRWMAEHDEDDPAPADKEAHRRVGVGIYYFESDSNEEDTND
jgi:hypothetical protein